MTDSTSRGCHSQGGLSSLWGLWGSRSSRSLRDRCRSCRIYGSIFLRSWKGSGAGCCQGLLPLNKCGFCQYFWQLRISTASRLVIQWRMSAERCCSGSLAFAVLRGGRTYRWGRRLSLWGMKISHIRSYLRWDCSLDLKKIRQFQTLERSKSFLSRLF